MSDHRALLARMSDPGRATPPRLPAARMLVQRDDVVGPNKAVDPGDNTCSLTWTLGSGWKYLKPSGAACDPGIAGVKGSGDSAQFPYNDYPDTPSTSTPGIDRPFDCKPPKRWEPPSQKNLFTGRCRPPLEQPPAAPAPAIPLPPPGPAPQPGDYNVPDPNAAQQVG